jgi:hypothetical protein
MVNHAAADGDRLHTARNCGMTAEAESHVVIDKTKAAARSASARR